MNQQEHKDQAETYLRTWNQGADVEFLQAAQVHATLATIPDVEYQEKIHPDNLERFKKSMYGGSGDFV